MSKLNKFEDVDVFASLNAIMKQNTGFFQSDFDIDREIIAKAAASARISRVSKISCFVDFGISSLLNV